MILNWLLPDLKHFLNNEKPLPHALLITGAPGTGKSAFSLRLAAGLLCETPKSERADGLACGHCKACHWLEQGTHPDLRRIMPAAFDPTYDPSFTGAANSSDADDDEPAEKGAEKAEKKKSSEITVDQIRAMSRFLSVGGHRGGLRVVLVDPATSMNHIAANAFLKTLEEPLGNTIILMLASRPSQISATLRSRCVAHPLAAPTADEAQAFVAEHAPEVTKKDRIDALQMAGGMPLRALALVRGQESAGYRLALDVIQRLPETGWRQASTEVSQLPAPQWVAVLQYWIADLARVSNGAGPMRFGAQLVTLKQLAGSSNLSLHQLLAFGQWLDTQRRWASHPLNPRLFAEDILMRYCKLF
jgi:DNA polymerase III subunit delta'